MQPFATKACCWWLTRSLTKLLTEEKADMGIQTLFGELDDTSSGFDERIEFPRRSRRENARIGEKISVYISSHPLWT